MLFQHSSDHRSAGLVDPADGPPRRAAARCGQQCLDFPDERPFSVQRHGDRGTGDGCRPLVQEQVRRVDDTVNSVVVQEETSDFIGGAESVLDPADHPQRTVAVPFKMQHNVDEVL
ncbi:Uncharacterised protein [Mycobacterium tuberculosis]|uniref:Uncharacterized protein n=1 Tax=Mycobacterium tuberculosis TaxID=1773 RepID=A0A0T9C0J0_MYCTX|nr:Uncharacterised protein [Mycobacterium tuberculosis]CKR23020.1 Uncharacterised protein [Mycobacterium tuberculosis]CKR32026.1 Uncharacterised protein [Mycobacterium tuberculosis]CKR79412.1 Uncharacterised protein [Mycobacterium tuberculosis]CKT58498.1 Uncharacterised protein [Mycobacterium tuberculosis]